MGSGLSGLRSLGTGPRPFPQVLVLELWKAPVLGMAKAPSEPCTGAVCLFSLSLPRPWSCSRRGGPGAVPGVGFSSLQLGCLCLFLKSGFKVKRYGKPGPFQELPGRGGVVVQVPHRTPEQQAEGDIPERLWGSWSSKQEGQAQGFMSCSNLHPPARALPCTCSPALCCPRPCLGCPTVPLGCSRTHICVQCGPCT